MPEHLRNTLIRVFDMGLARNYGNVVVAEVLRRRVDYGPYQQYNTPGAVLIDSTEALGPIADMVRRSDRFIVIIRSTDELLWIPTRADLSAGDYWTVEMVPWAEYLRAALKPDEQVIREAHHRNV